MNSSGAYMGRYGGRCLVFAKHGTKSPQSMMPNARKHLTILTFFNVVCKSMPMFHILTG
jgi:hypothetical protein